MSTSAWESPVTWSADVHIRMGQIMRPGRSRSRRTPTARQFIGYSYEKRMVAKMNGKHFNDNVVILTGASSGIGKELAYFLADDGAWLVLASRNLERLEEVASECRERGGKAVAVQTDVEDEAQCKRLIERAVEEYGRIDTLINNAGYGMRARLDELPNLDRFRALMDANLMGSVCCTYYALPHIKQTKGRIVGVSSVVGKFATPRNSAYCASKFAMAGFFESLRLELMEEGISVTMVFPGLTVTEFAERIERPDGEPVGERGKRMYTHKTMSAETAAKHMYRAIALRKRDLVLSREAKVALWIHHHFPKVFDKITLGFYRKRAKAAKGK